MKKAIRFMLVAAAATALLSCAKEITTDNASELAGIPMKEYTFQAGVDTRAALGNDGLTVVWESTDKIRVYYKDSAAEKPANADATLVSSEGGEATFKVTLPETVILDTLYAVYKPSDGTPFGWKDDDYESGITTNRVEFKASQAAANGNFDRNAAPMVSRWINTGDDTPAFSFHNLAGLIKIELNNQSSHTIDSIVFNNEGKSLAKYYWGFKHNTDNIVVKESTRSKKSVTLTGTFEGEGTYYIALPYCYSSGNYTGITLSFYSGDKVKTFSNSTPLRVARNTVYPLGSFTVTDEWFPVDEGFSIACQERTKADRDTTYSVAVSAKPGLEWTAAVTGEGATVEPASGTGAGSVTVKVPVNCNTTEAGDLKYVVTVATEDASIEEASRSQSVTLTQKHETKVLFGTKWGNSFFQGWQTAEFKADVEYIAEYVTAKTSGSIGTSSGKNYLKGNYSFKFTVGETGTGILSFDAYRGDTNKNVLVEKNGVQIYKDKYDDKAAHHYVIEIAVEAGDVINIRPTKSSSNSLYCGDNYPISWTGTPAPAATVSSVSCAVDEGY